MNHELKSDPEAFDAQRRGDKLNEVRFNDRDFQVDDILVLRRTEFSGEEMRNGAPLAYSKVPPLRRWVTHIQAGYGLKPGWCILSTKVPLD